MRSLIQEGSTLLRRPTLLSVIRCLCPPNLAAKADFSALGRAGLPVQDDRRRQVRTMKPPHPEILSCRWHGPVEGSLALVQEDDRAELGDPLPRLAGTSVRARLGCRAGDRFCQDFPLPQNKSVPIYVNIR